MYENFSTIQTANNGQMFRGYFRFIRSCVNFMKIARARSGLLNLNLKNDSDKSIFYVNAANSICHLGDV